ncbi:MAG: hypothetical protein HOP17_07210 [Acidobacteria bacterium]|nr:hypothetical protein [Acidobacteriota bacterium]
MKKKSTGPLIIGHRGASARAPENTRAAFIKAIEAGADGLEFDVRLARDGVPVVFHDATLSRTGGVSAAVSDLTSDELSKIDIGSWFGRVHKRNIGEDFASETIPTLAQTLDLIGSFDGIIFIELKCGEREVETLTEAVCAVLKGSPLLPNVILKSFKLAVITRAKVHLPGIRTAALFAPKIMTILRKEKHLVKIAEEFGADELSIHFSLATRKLMEKAAKRNFPVNVWTADSSRWVKRGTKLGLKSIITNDPAKLLARRAEI